MKLKTLLIANRGEIACRIIHTAKQLGIRTIAVYSEIDAGALHTRLADEACCIGPAPATESYLNVQAILAAAKQHAADAIHPGYGFLSENAAFAQACEAAAIVFIGPPVSVIEAAGIKSTTKALMEQAGIPVIPGYCGDNQDPAFLEAEAEKIGFPLLIKASAGGGGRGMRLVNNLDTFAAALQAAQQEAASNFGDPRVLLEKYLTQARHIEVQVFGDQQGDVVHLFERDCSLQRRHQKLIEFSPALHLSPSLRTALYEAALRATKTLGHIGAGTIEFLVDNNTFYFMEMNPRLQVEHPVTEMTTGQDLVEWQLRVATGIPLASSSNKSHKKTGAQHGHAIEARLYAENPHNHYLPSTGQIVHLRWPKTDHALRIDTGIQEGDSISIYYDPLIAKYIAWGEDHATATAKLTEALKNTDIVGVTTNRDLLIAALEHPDFREGKADNRFIEAQESLLLSLKQPIPTTSLVLLAVCYQLTRQTVTYTQSAGDPYSPWFERQAWRLNQPHTQYLDLLIDQSALPCPAAHRVTIDHRADHINITIEGETHSLQRDDLTKILEKTRCIFHNKVLHIFYQGYDYAIQFSAPLNPEAASKQQDRMMAPMPGRITHIAIKPGESVELGQALITLEAMKIQQIMTAPFKAVIESLEVKEQDNVNEGDHLLILVPL